MEDEDDDVKQAKQRLHNFMMTSQSDFSQTISRDPVQRECPVCLDRYTDARQLPCRHTFCLECLQYSIDMSNQNGGFNCALCHEFIHLEDPDESKSKWSLQFPADLRFGADTNRKSNTNVTKQARYGPTWNLEWQLTIHPKSHGHPPSAAKTHMKSFDLKSKPTTKTLERLPTPQRVRGNAKRLHTNKPPESFVANLLYVNEMIIVYDGGLGELLIYNEEGTLRYTMFQQPIYGIALLDGSLYMTNPASRCIEILQLDSMTYRRAIELTMRCYGIDTLGKSLVVLLSEGADPDHVTFVGKDGVIGGQINVDRGTMELANPRQVAVCKEKELIYVGDEDGNVVKCFSSDGELKWEKLVWNPGYLGIINKHLVITRKRTNAMDLLTSEGEHIGQLESEEYEISLPNIIAVNEEKTAVLVVDKDSYVHMFHLEERPLVEKSICCTVS